MSEINKEDIRKKYGIEQIEKLAMHDDADGMTSGALLTFAFKTKQVWCPEDFGEWKPLPEPEKGYIPPDVCCDMIPKYSEWTGLCFDHHPGHLPVEQRKYKLVWGEVPATLLVFKTLKDLIPEEEWWKVAIGCVGDGQAELIPSIIWKKFPILLENYTSIWEQYGKLNFNQFPVYMRLSSSINAACKIPDKWYIAYQVLRAAKTPWQILEDPALTAAKKTIDEETRRVIKETNCIDMSAHFRFWVVNTEFKIERTLAWRSEEASHKTTMVMNEKTGRISMRGALSEFYCEELMKVGYNIHGHPGFAGGKLGTNQTVQSIYEELRKIKI